MVFNATKQYFSYFVPVSFIGGGNRSTQRKPPTASHGQTLSHDGVSHTPHHQHYVVVNIKETTEENNNGCAQRHFQQHFFYIEVVSAIGVVNNITQRKRPTFRESP